MCGAAKRSFKALHDLMVFISGGLSRHDPFYLRARGSDCRPMQEEAKWSIDTRKLF
jgi:hypothetical protein